MRVGEEIRTESGRRLKVEGELPSGLQGTPYRVTDLSSRAAAVIKLFSDALPATKRRIDALVDAALHRLCPVLCAPSDRVTADGRIGHVSAMALGRTLHEALKDPGTFDDHMALALALAHALDLLHRLGFAHGDLHADNIYVFRGPGGIAIFVIDFDNFVSRGVPAPPALGQVLYMAPELRKAMAEKRASVAPDVRSDRFALTVLMHDLLLLRHPAAGADQTEPAFQRAMCQGRWADDPARSDRPATLAGGYPSETLNADLARLFRRGFSLDPDERPTAAEWAAALRTSLWRVSACQACFAPCVVDASKKQCPACRVPFPARTLLLPGGPLALAAASFTMGRNHLGGAPRVSERHAIFRREGPETTIESVGRNGTYRWAAERWHALPEGRPVGVQAGDRLKFADVEVAVA